MKIHDVSVPDHSGTIQKSLRKQSATTYRSVFSSCSYTESVNFNKLYTNFRVQTCNTIDFIEEEEGFKGSVNPVNTERNPHDSHKDDLVNANLGMKSHQEPVSSLPIPLLLAGVPMTLVVIEDATSLKNTSMKIHP